MGSRLTRSSVISKSTFEENVQVQDPGQVVLRVRQNKESFFDAVVEQSGSRLLYHEDLVLELDQWLGLLRKKVEQKESALLRVEEKRVLEDFGVKAEFL